MVTVTLVLLLFVKSSAQIILPLFVLGCLVTFWQQRSVLHDKHRLSGWWPCPLFFLFLFVALAGVSILWAVDPGRWINKFPKLVLLLVLLLTAILFADRKVHVPAYRLMTWVFGISAVLFVLVVMVWPGPVRTMGRIGMSQGLFFWPVLAAVFLVPQWKRYRLLLGSLVGGILLLTAFLTSSQGMILSLLGGGMVFLLTYRWPDLVPKVLAVLFSLVAFFMPFLVYLLAMLPDIWTQVDFLRLASAAHRIKIWKSTLEGILNAPFAGWGIDASTHFRPSYLATRYFQGPLDFGHHPHNVFLQGWFDLGVAGAVLLALLVFCAGRQLLRIDKTIRPHAAGLYTAVILVLCVSYGLYQTWWLATIIMLVIAFPGGDDLSSGVKKGKDRER